MQCIVADALIRIRIHIGTLAEGRLRGIERDVLHGIDIVVGIGANARITCRILDEGSALAGMVGGRSRDLSDPNRRVPQPANHPDGLAALQGNQLAQSYGLLLMDFAMLTYGTHVRASR